VSFAADACEALRSYPWPGNVRELRNFIERMLILYSGRTIARADLPPEIKTGAAPAGEYVAGADAGGDFKSARNAFEAAFLAQKLQEYGGNISRMAEAVGLERSYLSRKLKTYNLHGG
jgi:two-component system nitrogen regulation response regulator NtrX